ncbi:MAG: Gx transporter family protein [Lachnospiraceae bacterium]|nr:Gx transporter family protein [Lachnospiraceae bacterium]
MDGTEHGFDFANGRVSGAKTVALCGMLTALAMLFSYVETLIPLNFGIPGIKLGLANLVVLTGLYYLKPQQVLAVSLARILLTGFLFGNGMSILYSLAGGLLSFLVMRLLMRTGEFSPAGVSIAGGVAHNAGQLIVAGLVVHTAKLVYYMPVLTVSGALTGFLMGLLSIRVLHALKLGGGMKKRGER